jgi:dipeptidyl aminopeptidase/acylaminoacyl peptidase
MICWLHGGPTDQWQVTFMPRLAYWRDRGWSILVPDHRGSTGHGRAYQVALDGRWGELDVADTAAAIHHAHHTGLGDPGRTVLMGSSAGGYTALLTAAHHPTLVAAAVVLYPVTELTELVERSHRFERHSLEHLVGPLPASRDRYLARSPLHLADRLAATPLLVLHGDADPVVPVDQSIALAERILDAGGDVELRVYPGEGHGFRASQHQLDEYLRIGAFFERHGLAPRR